MKTLDRRKDSIIISVLLKEDACADVCWELLWLFHGSGQAGPGLGSFEPEGAGGLRSVVVLGFLLYSLSFSKAESNLFPTMKNNPTPGISKDITWFETTREDFIDGELDPALYVSFRNGGTVEFFPRFDVNNDGYFDLAAVDFYGPYLRLYLGSDSGYSSTDVILYPISSGGGTDLSDLNCDGYAELIHSGYGMGNLSIYRGTPNGPEPTNPTLLPNSNGETVYAADLDKDGYIDVIVAGTVCYIYWGDSTGYSASRRTTLTLPGGACHNLEVGDLNHDSWFDIIVVVAGTLTQPIFYGGPNRTFRRETLIYQMADPHGCSIGDLNGDGNLDVVYTGMRGIYQSYVYWGTANGPDPNNHLVLNPGPCYGGSVLTDWNNDGLLDIIYLRGGPPDAYSPGKPLLYINQGNPPYFSDSDRQGIGNFTFDASGGFIADFDFDGSLDFFMNNISADNSDYLLWGPDYTRTTQLPCMLDHHGTFREPGSIYDRRFRATYISSVFDAGQVMHRGVIRWNAYEPAYSLVVLRVRSGNTPRPDSTWNDWLGVNNADSLPPNITNRRYYQYQALLGYGRPANLPWLEEVELNLDFHTTGVSIEPDSEAWTLPATAVEYFLTVSNQGSWAEDTILLSTGKTAPGWQSKLFDSTGSQEVNALVMAKNETATIRLRVLPPVQAVAYALDTTAVIARSSIEPASTDTATLITHIRPVAGVEVYPDRSDTTDPGTSVNFPLVVKNNGNGADTVDLKFDNYKNWQVDLLETDGVTPLADHNGNGVADMPGVTPYGGTKNFIARVTPPASFPPATSILDTTIVTGRSAIDTSSADNALLETFVSTPPLETVLVSITFDPDTTRIIERPDSSTIFPLRLSVWGKNLASRQIYVDLDIVPNRWSAELFDSIGSPLKDGNQNTIPDLGPITMNNDSGGAEFLVRVTVSENSGYIVGPVDSLRTDLLTISGRCSLFVNDTLTLFANDQAHLTTMLVPPLNVHNYPNPFTGRTTFIFSLPEPGKVSLRIFNRAGEFINKLIDNQNYPTGIHTWEWNGNNANNHRVAPGLYLYRFVFAGESKNYKNGTVIIKKAIKVP
jgi:hypothetical protein